MYVPKIHFLICYDSLANKFLGVYRNHPVDASVCSNVLLS